MTEHMTENMKETYSIGQLANLAGVSVKTLRVYERKGLLVPERNEENSYRIYGDEAVKTLEKIQLMKYLDFSLDQISEFLQLYENISREKMLREQKRLLERKSEQIDRVISHVDRAIQECQTGVNDENEFLRSLGIIVKNRRADELVGSLRMHADEPRGWSRFIFDEAKMKRGMHILDAGAGYGNLWRYNIERLPGEINVTCVDKHNTHMDTFCDYIKEKKIEGYLKNREISFLWDDLETMSFDEKYDRIFLNHVAGSIENREALYCKLASALSKDGVFICTWGGFLLYEKLQIMFHEFFGECSHLDDEYDKHKKLLQGSEDELRTVFSEVVRHDYILTLSFDTADDFTEFVLQVCRPVREDLEKRRLEFIDYLEKYRNPEGGFTFERDTYLYSCRKGE